MSNHNKKLRQAIGQFLYQRMNAKGMAYTYWGMHKELVNQVEIIYNNPKSTKAELIHALETMTRLARCYIAPRFRMDNEIRIEAAEKILAEARSSSWLKIKNQLIRLLRSRSPMANKSPELKT